MSKTGKIRQFFGDAEHDFQLNIGQLMELEEELGEGVGVLHFRLTPTQAMPFGAYSVKSVKMVLRLGLIGAGMDKEPAARLVDREVMPTLLGQAAMLAWAVVAAATVGVDEPSLGEDKGEAAESSRLSPTGSPTGSSSIEPAAPSAGRPKSLTERRSGNSTRRSQDSKMPTTQAGVTPTPV